MASDKESPFAEAEARIHERSKCYISESNLAAEQGRADIAHTAASLFEVLHALTLEKLSGTGRAEEMRNITAIAGAYRRAMLDLGVTAEKIEPDDEEL